MAVIEVSEDGVRRSAGGEVFGQAREWAGKVSGLRADGPAITRTERLLNYENCHGEGITEALEKAQDVHLAACEAGTPDPEVLAERLATGALESGWGVFRDGPARYARVLGAAGLARYRELLANAPARQHGQDALWTSLHNAETAQAAD